MAADGCGGYPMLFVNYARPWEELYPRDGLRLLHSQQFVGGFVPTLNEVGAIGIVPTRLCLQDPPYLQRCGTGRIWRHWHAVQRANKALLSTCTIADHVAGSVCAFEFLLDTFVGEETGRPLDRPVIQYLKPLHRQPTLIVPKKGCSCIGSRT